jgi:hypothetical protein
MSGTAPYDTQAFSPVPGRCFRLVSGGQGGGPTHCPEPPAGRGPFHTPNGRRDRSRRARASGPGDHRPRLSRELLWSAPGVRSMPVALCDR